ncbi:hypothetical protein [Enterococcus casseliflavus]|uniref:hypothetical protein n=1 Tax=Enterococcus casseliflavus TaxID=37734 RepID=UPI003DA1F496
METRNQKFKRLAESRMNRIFENMNLIANLSNRGQYYFTSQDIDELFTKYHQKGNEVKSYFQSELTISNSVKTSFHFENSSDIDEINEIKRARFRRIAETRMNRVFKDMRLIANLSNKTNYNYSKQDVDLLFDAYEEKGNEVYAHFAPLKEYFSFGGE